MPECTIREIHRTETHAYGLQAVVCANAETLCPWEDPTGNGHAEEADEVSRAIWETLEVWIPGVCCETDGYFAHWNGGRYDGSTNLRRWVSRGRFVLRPWTVELDDGYTDGDWGACMISQLPREVKSVIDAACEQAEYAAESAIKAIQAREEAAESK